MQSRRRYDVVIVGGGVAGLSAALVLGRARRDVVVIDAGTPRNAPAHTAHGVLTRDGVSPHTIVDLARQDLEPYGVDLLDGSADAVRCTEDGWIVSLADGTEVQGRQVMLATGLRDVLPDIPGAREAWGRGLLQCPYCHGWEVRDGALGVLGSSPASVQQALLVRQWSENITFFPHTLDPLSEDDERRLRSRGVRIVHGPVARLALAEASGSPASLEGMVLDDGSFVACEAVFCEPGADIDLPLLEEFGCDKDEDGTLATDHLGRTSVNRVWAVGNVMDPSAQLASAAGDAYRTAIAVHAVLVQEDCSACASAQEVLSGAN